MGQREEPESRRSLLSHEAPGVTQAIQKEPLKMPSIPYHDAKSGFGFF